jgi:hypothetical protein
LTLLLSLFSESAILTSGHPIRVGDQVCQMIEDESVLIIVNKAQARGERKTLNEL